MHGILFSTVKNPKKMKHKTFPKEISNNTVDDCISYHCRCSRCHRFFSEDCFLNLSGYPINCRYPITELGSGTFSAQLGIPETTLCCRDGHRSWKSKLWEEKKYFKLENRRWRGTETKGMKSCHTQEPYTNQQGSSDIIRLVIYCCRFFCREQYFLFRSNHKLKTANYIWQKLTDYVPTIWQSEVVRNENSVTSGAKQSRDLSSVVISISSSSSQSWVSSCKTQWKYLSDSSDKAEWILKASENGQ